MKFWQFLVGIFLIQLAIERIFSFPPHLTFVSALLHYATTCVAAMFAGCCCFAALSDFYVFLSMYRCILSICFIKERWWWWWWPGENRTSKISLFYQMRYDCLINITRKNTFCLHFWHFGWHFTQLFIFQLPATIIVGSLCEHEQGDIFSIYWQQYR